MSGWTDTVAISGLSYETYSEWIMGICLDTGKTKLLTADPICRWPLFCCHRGRRHRHRPIDRPSHHHRLTDGWLSITYSDEGHLGAATKKSSPRTSETVFRAGTVLYRYIIWSNITLLTWVPWSVKCDPSFCPNNRLWECDDKLTPKNVTEDRLWSMIESEVL